MGAKFFGDAPKTRKAHNKPRGKSVSQVEAFEGCAWAYALNKKYKVRKPAFLKRYSEFGTRVHDDLATQVASAPLVQPYIDAWEAWLIKHDYEPVVYEYRIGEAFNPATKEWYGEPYELFGHNFTLLIDCIVRHLVTGKHAQIDFKVTSDPNRICEKWQQSTYNWCASRPHISPLTGENVEGFDFNAWYYLVFEREKNLAFKQLHTFVVDPGAEERFRLKIGGEFETRMRDLLTRIDVAWASDVFEPSGDCTKCWERSECEHVSKG